MIEFTKSDFEAEKLLKMYSFNFYSYLKCVPIRFSRFGVSVGEQICTFLQSKNNTTQNQLFFQQDGLAIRETAKFWMQFGRPSVQFQQAASQTATAPRCAKKKTLHPNKSRVPDSGSFGASSNNRTTPFLYCSLKQNIGEPGEHVDRCLVRGDRPLRSGYEAWSGHGKTLRPKAAYV